MKHALALYTLPGMQKEKGGNHKQAYIFTPLFPRVETLKSLS